MRQLFPSETATADPLDIYISDERPAPPGRPWVMINMIASIDGATAIDGVSGGLGGPGDKAVFAAIRASCDWILVASGTARAERYRIPSPTDRTRQARVAGGRSPAPRLAVVSGSLELEADLPMLATGDDEDPAVLITGDSSPQHRIEALSKVAEVVKTPQSRPTPASALAVLAAKGAEVVLVEGGPSFNAQFATAGLVDEFCMSISPRIVAGDSHRIVGGGPDTADLDFSLERLLEHDGMLFARYLRS